MENVFNKTIGKMSLALLSLGLLFNSCVKEPDLITQEEYKARNANLYYFTSSTSQNKIVPEAWATVNNDGVYLSIHNDPASNSSSELYLSMHVENASVGQTDFNYFNFRNGINDNWAMKASTYGYYDFEHSNSYLNITKIDQSNKTITGAFVVSNIMGYFKDLPYSTSATSGYLYQEAKFSIVDNTNYTYYTGNYETSELYRTGTYSSYTYRANLKYNKYLYFNFSNKTNGTYPFTSSDIMQFKVENSSSYYYTNPTGTYTVTDYTLDGRSYKKYTFNATLSYSYYYYGTKTIQINGGEILLHQ